jgi:hypothetical protein
MARVTRTRQTRKTTDRITAPIASRNAVTLIGPVTMNNCLAIDAPEVIDIIAAIIATTGAINCNFLITLPIFIKK